MTLPSPFSDNSRLHLVQDYLDIEEKGRIAECQAELFDMRCIVDVIQAKIILK